MGCQKKKNNSTSGIRTSIKVFSPIKVFFQLFYLRSRKKSRCMLYVACRSLLFYENFNLKVHLKNKILFLTGSKGEVLGYFGAKQNDDEKTPTKKSGIQSLPETDVYLHLLSCIYFIDTKNNEKVGSCCIIHINSLSLDIILNIYCILLLFRKRETFLILYRPRYTFGRLFLHLIPVDVFVKSH